MRSSLDIEADSLKPSGAPAPIPAPKSSEIVVFAAGLIGLSCLQDHSPDDDMLWRLKLLLNWLLYDPLDMISGSTG